MLINCTNHPSEKWLEDQMTAAVKEYKSVVDVPFPKLDASMDTREVFVEALAYREDILELLDKSQTEENAVLVMGEFVFTYALVRMLQEFKVKCVVTTSDRVSKERVKEDGTIERISEFKFVRFREYPVIASGTEE